MKKLTVLALIALGMTVPAFAEENTAPAATEVAQDVTEASNEQVKDEPAPTAQVEDETSAE